MIPISDRNYSPYRRKDAQGWINLGFADFRVVNSLTAYRGTPIPRSIPESNRKNYVVICRPSSSGRYGKSVIYRVIPA